MIQTQYASFKEIDRDLKILKLQRQIEEEKVKLAVQNTKEKLYPTNIVGGLAPLLQKVAQEVRLVCNLLTLYTEKGSYIRSLSFG